VPSKTITSFLMSNKLSHVLQSVSASNILRNFSCLAFFFAIICNNRDLDNIPSSCGARNATAAALTRFDEFVSALNICVHVGIFSIGAGGGGEGGAVSRGTKTHRK